MAHGDEGLSWSSILTGLPADGSRKESVEEGEPAAHRRNWSFRVGSLFGIDLYIHATFLFLLTWVAISHLVEGQGAAEAASGVAMVLAVFTVVVLHELGHALMARRFGIRTRDITLLPIGGIARVERMPEKPVQELLVALAGPAVNAVLALVLFAILAALRGPVGVRELHVVGGPFLTKLMWINISLGVFNLLPAFPMDGGRALRAVLALHMEPAKATAAAARLGRGMALVLGIIGMLFNPILLLIALFVWMGAGQEVTMMRIKQALQGVLVQRAMITQFQTLSPQDRLSRVAELVISGHQADFPVVDAGHPVGLLTHADLIQGLAQKGGDALVQDAMRREFATAAPSETIEVLLNRSDDLARKSVLVMQDGHLMGILTAGNIGEYLLVKETLKAHDAIHSA